MDPVSFAVVDPGGPEARWAMERYFAELDSRFPGGFDAGDALDEAAELYKPPTGSFVLATAGRAPVGCGAVIRLDGDRAEIKRMWVSPQARGAGVGRRLLQRLEQAAWAVGAATVLLDTNGVLAEAIALYESSGYQATGRYNDNPYAERWFTKPLQPEVRRSNH